MNKSQLKELYNDKYFESLSAVASTLEQQLKEVMIGIERIDSIKTRAKSINRFVCKAIKNNQDGSLKYEYPMSQIQDQIGARITVFYLQDIDIVKKQILKHLRHIEMTEKSPSEASEFGYFGTHFILKIPDDVLPDPDNEIDIPVFFELQIKTLFQHAWSEAHHDLGYKSARKLTGEEKRKIAFTSAQAWGADKIFQELVEKMCQDNDNDSELS